MDPLSIVASTIAVIQAIASTFKAIKHLRGLPKELIEVGRSLPLAEDSLRLIRDQLHDTALDESSGDAIQPLVSFCEEKAKQLHNILKRIEKGSRNATDGGFTLN